VVQRLSASLLGWGRSKALEAAEQADGVFAVVAAGGTELVEDATLPRSVGVLVAQEHGFEVLAFGSRTHFPVSLPGDAPVTWNMSQRPFSIAPPGNI